MTPLFVFALLFLALQVAGFFFLLAHLKNYLKESQQSRDKENTELRFSLQKDLSDQRTDFRDVALKHFESLHHSIQESLGRQSSTLEQRFEVLQRQSDTRLSEIQTSVQKKLQENLDQNFGAFKELSQSLGQIKSSADQMLRISQQVEELNRILGSPKLQGNFGEMALEQLLNELLPKHAFEWQPRLAEGCQPDAAIRIRNTRLCIDAKFPKDRLALLTQEIHDEASLAAAQKELSRTVRDMASDISKKYVRPELGTTDQAFLFVPSERFYYEILRMPEVMEHCRKVKVTPVSPNTLAATLYAVALAFRGYEMEENARQLLKTIQDMEKHFDAFRSDFEKIGQRLNQAQEDYTKASRDLERFDKTIKKLRDGESLLQEN